MKPSLTLAICATAMCAIVGPVSAPAQSRGEALSRIQARLDALQRERGFPGATVGIAFPDGEVVSLVTGYADVERRVRLSPGDRMLSGSIGKAFVAAVALRLVDRGAISLDAPIRPLFEGVTWFDRLPNARGLTMRSLLGHTSGLPEYLEDEQVLGRLRQDPLRAWTPEERLAGILGDRPVSEVGDEFHYTDSNYILAGAVIERAGGEPYERQLETLLSDLGLDSTEPVTARDVPGLVQGYSENIRLLGLFDRTRPVEIGDRTLGAVLNDGKYVLNPQLEWAGGGLVTTAADLAHAMQALYGKQAQGALTELRTGGGERYGLGTQIRHSGHWGLTFGHSGWMPGYHSAAEYFPDHGIAIAIQVNTDDTDLVEPRHLLFEVMGILSPTGD